jgi:hypothetical protein
MITDRESELMIIMMAKMEQSLWEIQVGRGA